ncbi:sosondowah ankyrin repeat domain family Cb [Rhinichthys klamathensis goyatoka]|uniref:sosondowah ankyrin repeat domain family Cb n=1 Tax=Rhinichthys klamathensis goyatoka TaxID=3034132 RepID=UPI0024B550BA|nr:sosondowah ankyrin repeat domain family Cb [Rhinichthys klamathensis goyatoka]
MATECNQEAVLYFIKENGGRVKNADLTDNFRATIPKDPALKQAAKEAFKRYVDSVAYVKEENGEKYVCLKKKFRRSNEKSDMNELKSHGEEEHKACVSKSGGKEGMLMLTLPGSGYGTGHVKSQPDPSVRFSQRATESDMGNKHSSTTKEDKTDLSPKINRSESKDEEQERKQSEGTSLGNEVKSESESGKENRLTDDFNRKHFTEGLIDSSSQVRLRSSVYLPGRCRDSPRPDADYEPASLTLEPLEHDWMMSASDGHWDSLHRLLLRDPSLITRKDFITGFTCLHWASKLGKHELIVMLVNFAKENGIALNVNARSSAGYTPLHLAAMHNHLEVVKLLVGAFDADVEARDYNGRKACQYLKSDIAQNILDIVGACVESDTDHVDVGDTSRWRLSRVIQSNFRPLKTQNHNSSEEESSGVTRKSSLRRKSSFTKMRPSLNKISLRSQIVHSTSLMDRFEKDATEEPSNLSRPKSNLFG